MSKTLFRNFLLLPLIILLTGCPPTNKATFINTSDNRIKVVILDAENQQTQSTLLISGNTKHQERIYDLTSQPSVIKGYDDTMTELFTVNVDPATAAKKLTPKGTITLEFDESALIIK